MAKIIDSGLSWKYMEFSRRGILFEVIPPDRAAGLNVKEILKFMAGRQREIAGM